MKNILPLFILCTAFFSLSSSVMAEEAVIIALSGKAELTQKGTVKAAAAGDRLNNGDSLAVTSGEATLVTSGGKLQTVSAGSAYTIKAEQKVATKGLTERLMASLSETTTKHEGPTVKGMVRGEEGIQPIFPHNTVIFSEDLRFIWKSELELEGMKFELKKRNPRFAFSTVLGDESTELLYPKDAPELESKVPYYWKVEGYDMLTGEPSESQLVWFEVLNQKDENTIKKEINEIKTLKDVDDNVKTVLYVGIYSSHRLYSNALQELKTALTKQPENKTLQHLKNTIQRKMGVRE